MALTLADRCIDHGKVWISIVNLKEIIESNRADMYTFGRFVRERRELLGKSVRGFARELGITSVYLRDIENGNRYAPKAKLEELFRLLEVEEEQREAFMDAASLTRGEFEDINPYLGSEHYARLALRKAEKKNLSAEKWEEILRIMD